MGKNIDDTEVEHPEESVTPKLVFSDDVLVVDYLNALLASTPSSSPDSAEIHFVHLANGASWKPAFIENGFVGTAIANDNDFAKREIDELKKANEHLKFKIELSDIDSQVLRGENNNLKNEIAELTGQLNEIKIYLNEVLNQNIEFQSKIEELEKEIDLSLQIGINLSPPELPSLPENEETSIEADIEPELEKPVQPEPLEINLQNEEPASNLYEEVPNDPIIVPELTKSEPVIMADLPEITARIHPGIDEDTALISHQQVVIAPPPQNTPPEPTVFSHKHSSIITPTLSARPDSKVLKHEEVKQLQLKLEKRETIEIDQNKISLPSEFNKDEVLIEEGEVLNSFDLKKEEPDTELKVTEDGESSTDTVSLNRDCIDEIDMESAPDPKIVVQRNVKLYEDIQSVTDGSKAVKEAHGIVL